MSYAVLIANSRSVAPSSKLMELAKNAELIVAADGGANHCNRLGLKPDLIVGDLDSLSTDAKNDFQNDIEFKIFPRDKDKTDLELALEEVDRRHLDEIHLFGWSDERVDYSLGALLSFEKIKTPITAYGDGFKILSLNIKRPKVVVKVGETLSIIRLRLETKILSEGLEWDISWDLPSQTLLSQSNRVLKKTAEISASSGTAFVLLNSI